MSTAAAAAAAAATAAAETAQRLLWWRGNLAVNVTAGAASAEVNVSWDATAACG
jgi:hypothetical protein